MSIFHRAYRRVNSICSCLDEFVIERQLRRLGVGHAHRISTHTTPLELHTLFRLAQGCPPNAAVLEIGSYLGASTCYIAAGIAQRNGKIFCVDTWTNETMQEGLRDTYAEFRDNTGAITPWLEVIRKRSEYVVEDDLIVPLHLVFIDGDHSYASVQSDFQRVSSWLAPNGVVAFHDSRYFPGVSRVIGEALATGHWVMLGCLENLCWIKPAPLSWLATNS